MTVAGAGGIGRLEASKEQPASSTVNGTNRVSANFME
jgi:hypothetical protein